MSELLVGLETALTEVRSILKISLISNVTLQEILIKQFKHRAWNHICWTFQSKSGLSRIYLNGKFVASFTITTEFVRSGILGSEEVCDSAFIIGQDTDPPSVRGGFEKDQVFVLKLEVQQGKSS